MSCINHLVFKRNRQRTGIGYEGGRIAGTYLIMAYVYIYKWYKEICSSIYMSIIHTLYLHYQILNCQSAVGLTLCIVKWHRKLFKFYNNSPTLILQRYSLVGLRIKNFKRFVCSVTIHNSTELTKKKISYYLLI